MLLLSFSICSLLFQWFSSLAYCKSKFSVRRVLFSAPPYVLVWEYSSSNSFLDRILLFRLFAVYFLVVSLLTITSSKAFIDKKQKTKTLATQAINIWHGNAPVPLLSVRLQYIQKQKFWISSQCLVTQICVRSEAT